ncbi:MAG: dihydroorotate dehydrogenase [Gammaproteobacteria bacterium SG8_47]|nr:MAG: dihydroorotate dehydrogenase [Gammaproteobacteria bacterium SG8_47]
MIDLRTRYLGLELDNPLVPSASPLSRDLDSARRLEDAGAAALVMYSLFEEELQEEERQLARFLFEQGTGHAEADSFFPLPTQYTSRLDSYLEQIASLKSALGIPVIASLNGVSDSGWIQHGKEMQEAGADALELNVYYVAAGHEASALDIEQRYLDLLRALRQSVSIPIAMKLSTQFTALPHFVRRLAQAGADGVALFNRFYQPDIDLETLRVTPRLELSTSAEALLRIRWTAILRGQVDVSLAVTGGFHDSDSVLKALLAGADVVHLCSALLAHGAQRLAEIKEDMTAWLQAREYSSVAQLKGSVSQQHALDPAAYERANYVQVIDSYTPPAGVLR